VSKPAKIIVGDDTPKNIKILADLVAVKGYSSIVIAGSGCEALDTAADVIISEAIQWLASAADICMEV